MMINQAHHVDPQSLIPLIESYRGGDAAAGDSLCKILLPIVRLDTARMLGDDNSDVDDVVQESLLACLGYLGAERGFAGDAVRLAVTIARNRCRDLLRWRGRQVLVAIEPLESWLTDTSRSVLDELVEHEMETFLQEALAQLPEDCRSLLLALYVEGQTPESIRARSDLNSVHGIYYRRGVCLEKVRKILQRRMRFGSGTNAGTEGDRAR